MAIAGGACLRHYGQRHCSPEHVNGLDSTIGRRDGFITSQTSNPATWVFGRPAIAEFERFAFDRCWRDTTPRPKPQAGMVGVICTTTAVHFYGADDPTTSTAQFEREAHRLGSTPDTATWARPQPVPDVRFPDPTPPPGAGEQYSPRGETGTYAKPVRWQQAYTEHAFVVRASVTIQYRTERTKPKPTPSRTPMFPQPPATCAGGHRPWSCL
ncbi:hypothetical protein [Embleya sp. MST-111070]|uniref:hypothetical protein n=1 Tax=Embleya sp. MST-111070 TaxID=3398231 RepID=UPI003F735A7E